MRDSERQKVYDAENWWAVDMGVVGIDEAADIIDLLCQDFQIRTAIVSHNPTLKDMVGQYHARGLRIVFRNNTPTLKTVLHEFAHHLAASRSLVGRFHGGRFTEAMLDTVRVYTGDPAQAHRLRNEFLRVGLLTSADEETDREEKIHAQRRRQEERVGEKADLWIVSYRTQEDRVWFLGRSAYLERKQEGVTVYRRAWAAYQKADEFAGGLCEVHLIEGIFDYPEWDGYGYPAKTPRWMPVNDTICDEVAVERERQIMKEDDETE